MNNEDILKSDLLDIVFDNRNKDYGAYELRRHYRKRLIKSIIIAFIIGGGAVSLAVMIKKEKIIENFIPEVMVYNLPEVENEPKKPAPPKKAEMPKPPVASAAKPVAQQQYLDNIQITKDPAQASKINDLQENVAIGGENVTGEPKGQVFVPDPVKIDAGGNEIGTPKVDNITPRATADIMPAYPGGMKELRKFLERNLKSFDDIEQGKVVSVKITFVVGYDGKLKGFQVLEDGGDMYNKEVIRVLKKMPEWIPGKANGENVSVYYTIPVKFTAAE